MKTVRLNVTTATDGSGTSEIVGVSGGGLLYAVQCVDGDFADGVDLDITAEVADLSVPLFSVDNFNADGMYYPRVLENLSTDGTALTTHAMPVIAGRVKATIANGGSVKTGAVILYILER